MTPLRFLKEKVQPGVKLIDLSHHFAMKYLNKYVKLIYVFIESYNNVDTEY